MIDIIKVTRSSNTRLCSFLSAEHLIDINGGVAVICILQNTNILLYDQLLHMVSLLLIPPRVQTASSLVILITEAAFLPDTAMFPFDYLSTVTLTGLLLLDRWPWYWLEVNSKLHCWVRWRISIKVLMIRVQLKRKRLWVTCPDIPSLQHQTMYGSPSFFVRALKSCYYMWCVLESTVHCTGWLNPADLLLLNPVWHIAVQ